MWFTVEASLIRHPKTITLRQLLGEPLAEVYLIRWWAWLAEFRPDNGRMQPGEDIESVVLWSGEERKLYAALKESGFLDVDGLSAHDWADHAGQYLRQMKKHREAVKNYRAKDAAKPKSPGYEQFPTEDELRKRELKARENCRGE